MTIALRATMGGANTDSPGTGLILTTNAAAFAGDLVLVAVAKDNSANTDGLNLTNEVTGIVDSRNNGWRKIAEGSKSGGAAAAGAVISIWTSILGRAMPIGSTLQATTDLCSGKAMGAVAFSLSPGNEVYTPLAVATGTTNNGALGSVSSGSLTGSVETLFFRAAAIEQAPGTRGTPTPTASFTAAMDYYGSTMWVWAEYSIQTVSGLLQSAPTTVSASADSYSLFPAFRERVVPSVLFAGAPL